MMEISTDFVAKNYIMDPETEDLLFDGNKLEEGMVVLIGPDSFRLGLVPYGMERVVFARKYARWARVTELHNYHGDILEFIAVYGDGTKTKFSLSTEHPWYVKKDSVPVKELPCNCEICARFRDLMKDDMVETLKTTAQLKNGEVIIVVTLVN